MLENVKSRWTSHKIGTLLGLIGLSFWLDALVTYLAMRTSVYFWISLVLGIVLVAVFCIMRLEQVIDAIRSRQAIYGTNVAVAVILVVGIAVVVNVITAIFFDKEMDWTAGKTFTLSQQTKKVIRNLDKEIKVTAFFSRDPTNVHTQHQLQNAEDLLGRYAKESKKIKLEFIDPYSDPLKAQEYKIESNGTTVFEYEGKRELVTSVDEQKFTSSILKVTRDEIKKIYFLTGHDERSIDDYDREGYNKAMEALKKQNYQVEKLLLATQPKIPDDCSVLVIASPKSPLSEHEINSLEQYLDKERGKAIIMLDPFVSASEPNQNLINLLDKWGVEVKNDLAVDLDRPTYPFGKSVPLVDVKEFYHPITRDIRLPVPFSWARSVLPNEKPIPDITVRSLAKTSQREGGSWGETSRDKEGNFVDDGYTKGKDTPAPVSLAVAVQREREKSESTEKPEKIDTRIVVIGDSDFASNNEFFSMAGGLDFFLNAINWLTMEEDLIAIRPQPPEQRNLRPMLEKEVRSVLLLSTFAIPRLFFILGIIVWWRRR